MNLITRIDYFPKLTYNGNKSNKVLAQSSLFYRQDQDHFFNRVFSFTIIASLKCAVQLSMPDTINNNGKPMTLSDLANALPINPLLKYPTYTD